ncbi:hypothetical protein [Burkholderia diffusa]|uniref:hypothetical protein n=1 Tax=Burkholderia diffusa TaxID=488732 RepID=UPI002ED8CF28
MGVTRIEQYLATFSELAPGIETGCRDMNIPLFVTAERAKMVAFSVHVRESPADFSWALEISGDPPHSPTSIKKKNGATKCSMADQHLVIECLQ